MRRLFALLTALVLLAPMTALSVTPAAAAKTFKACVKKSNGKTVLLSGKKKCKKGWKKVTWTKSAPTGGQGPTGQPGATGSLGDVYDGTGARIGQLLGFTSIVFFNQFLIRSPDGGDWPYLSNGWLYSGEGEVYYDNAACGGTPFVAADDETWAAWLLGSPQRRLVYRPTSPFGAATAFKMAGTSSAVVAQARWYRDSGGNCVATSAFSGQRLPLVQVAAPPDRQGPLTVRWN